MGLMEAFRKAEEQAKQMARRSMERAMVGLDDAERAIRRRMRVYPKSLAGMGAMSQQANPQGSEPQPIVSVHGRDLTREETAEKKIA